MSDSSVQLNAVSVSGGQNVATYEDSGDLQHSKVVLETQTGSSDPVKVSSGNPLPVDIVAVAGGTAALDSSVNGLLAVQGTSTSGLKGPMVQAAAVSGSQSYTAGELNPLTQDLTGALRVNVVEGSGGGGTSIQDGSAFTRGTTTETPAAARVEAAPALTSGDIGVLSMDTAGNLRVVPNSEVASNSADSGNPIKVGAVYNSSAPSLTSGYRCDLQADSSGNLKVNVTNGIAGGTSTSPSTALVSSTPQASVSGGAKRSSTRITSPSNSVVTVKSSAGQVYSIYAYNGTGSVAYLHFYDVSGSVTLGTTDDTDVIPIPANTSGAGVAISLPVGIAFTNQIALAVTGGVATADNTATAASSSEPITVNVSWL